MSHDDFCKSTVEEFESICKAWREMTEGNNRDAWERARIMTAIIIQPHLKKKITPRQLLPLPWDNVKIPKNAGPKLNAEEQQRRFENVAKLFREHIG